MKKLKKKEKSGKKNIIKSVKRIFSKCIRLGRKRMWIPGVPSGENTTAGKGLRIPSWMRNIMTHIENRFLPKSVRNMREKGIIIKYENRAR